MGLVIQFQRRAIEKVFAITHVTITKENEFRLNGHRLNLLGISTGVGTCSDIWGVDIAVFEQNSQTEPLHPLVFPIHCQGLVLLRNLLPGEYKDQKKSEWYVGQSLLMVEGLEVKDKRSLDNLVNLKLSGRKSSYVHLV